MSATQGLDPTPRQRGQKNKARDLIEAVGGLSVAELHCRIGKSQLQECCSHHKSAFLPADVIADLESIAPEPVVTRHLAMLAGHVLVPLPRADEDETGLLLSVMELTSELGDVARALELALRDSDCSPAEAETALEQLDEHDRASARLRMKLRSLIEKKSG